jgi:hypothetical protein
MHTRIICKLTDAEIAKSLAGLRHAADIGGQAWDTFYKDYQGAKFRLEFPLGELATSNPDLQGCWYAAKSLGLVSEVLPIDGSEGFSAQGLEGKCAIEGYGTQLLTIYDTLAPGRRALYRVKVERTKRAKLAAHEPIRQSAMVLRFLPVNQAWVFLFGHDLNTATIQPMGDYGRFFPSRKDAVSAAKSCGITVADNGQCEVTK